MLDQAIEFLKTNYVAVAIGVVAIIALVVIFIYKRNASPSTQANMPPHDLEGMESMNTVCDLATGVCHPQDHAQQEQMQEQMQQEQMQMQQQADEGQQTSM